MQSHSVFWSGRAQAKGFFKMSAIMLAFLLAVSPILPAFAQMVDDAASNTTPQQIESSQQGSGPVDVSQTPTDASTISPDLLASQSNVLSPDSVADEQDSQLDGFIDLTKSQPTANKSIVAMTSGLSGGTSIAPNKLPDRAGAMAQLNQVVPQADSSTGALTYTYPITVPPGRNGMQPNLTLSYNNQAFQQNGPFGYGWSINIPYISRLNKTGTDTFYSSNAFASSLSGELVNTSGTSYISKVENGDFVQYTFSSNTWTALDKNGITYTFGSTAASRQDDPSNSAHITKWMLEKMQDANGNFITYTYYKNAGQIYPSTITYTNNGSTTGIYEVDFQRASRTDGIDVYNPSFAVKTSYEINEIDVLVNGSWRTKYALAYTTGINATKVMLSSITQSGKDTSGTTTTLPASAFSYQATQPSWGSTTTWNLPSTLTASFNSTVQHQFADLNGDGRQDLIQYVTVNYGVGTGGYVLENAEYLNTPTGWVSTSGWSLPNNLTATTNRNINCQFVDLNGDGLADIVEYVWYGAALQSEVYLNTGAGWSSSAVTGYAIPSVLTSTYNTNIPLQFADLNGDGLPDIIQYIAPVGMSGPTMTSEIYLNTGSGWNATSTWNLPNNFVSSYGTLGTVQFTDLNGDGLADMVESVAANTGTYVLENSEFINTGSGWTTTTTTWALPNTFTSSWGGFTTARQQFVDLNDDGLPDFVQWIFVSGTTYCNEYINTGTGWTSAPSSWDMPALSGATYYANSTLVQFVDLDGDGVQDVIQYVTANTGSGYVVGTAGYVNGGLANDLLNHITAPDGASDSITYKATSKYVDGSGNLTNPNNPLVLQTLYQDTSNDGAGLTSTNTYSYAGGLMYYDSSAIPDRKFAGFASITKTDPSKATKVYYHQGNSTDSTHGEYSDDYWKIGKAYRTEVSDLSSNLYSQQVNKWNDTSLGSGAKYVMLDNSVSYQYDGTSTHTDTATEYTYDSSNGDLLTKTEDGVVSAATNGTFTDTGSDKRITTYEYAVSGTTGVHVVKHATLTDASLSKLKEDKYYYDTLGYGSVGAGNQTKDESWVTGSTYINSQKAYNSYGLPTSTTDPRSKTTSYSYDTYTLYPATVTDPLTNATSYTYDYLTGKPLTKTDANSNVWSTSYDGLGRVLQETIPDPAGGSPVVKTSNTYIDTSGAVSVASTSNLDGTTSTSKYSYYDGYGRLIQERKQMESGYAIKDYIYNSAGKLQKESLPYSGSGTSKTSATGTTTLYDTYSYDPLDRMTSDVNNVGTTSYTYAGFKTSVTDPRSKVKDLYTDAYGNLVQIDEHNSGSTYTTTYGRDLSGNLTGITDALGNIRSFTYDGLGRRLTAEDLHASGDTTYGTWSYTYDNAGNMTQSVSPNSKTVNYTYDDTNRVLTENYTGAAGTEITYAYDSGTNGIGHLTSVTMTNGADTTYTYDKSGNEASEARTVNGNSYTTSFTHDRQGNQVVITYPDNAQVRYTYNSAGLLEKIERKQSGGSFTDVVSNFDYSPVNTPTTIAYANGVTTTNTYDATKLYRLTAKTSINGASSHLQDTAYTYDGNGNITQVIDASNTDGSKTANYVYDDLNRLTSATITAVASGQSPYTQTFVYNAIGDMTSGPAGSYTYGGSTGTNYANPHAATAIASSTLTYDNDGNQTSDGTLTNTWNYKGQLAQTVNGGTTLTYLYDHNGDRVSYSDGTTTTDYANKYYNYDGSIKTKQVYAGNQLIATITTSGSTVTPYYVHTDSILGSNIVSDGSGTKNQLLDYYPFGAVRINQKATSFNEQKQFGGHAFDSATALNYLGARYYNSSTGRFISEDPIFLTIGDKPRSEVSTHMKMDSILSDPQSLNSYTYAKDNPMKIVDPDGRWWKELITGQQTFNDFSIEIGQATQYLTQNSTAWNYAIDHPIKAGAVVGLAGGAAFLTAVPAISSYTGAIVNVAGNGTQLIANRLIEGTIYGYLSVDALKSIPDRLESASNLNKGDLKSYATFIGTFALDYVPGFIGEKTDATVSVAQLAHSITKGIANVISSVATPKRSGGN